MKNHYQIVIDQQAARIEELEAENEMLRQGEASEERWSEHYATRADELEAELYQAQAVSAAQAGIIAANRAEIDRLCAMLGEADAELTAPPQSAPRVFNQVKKLAGDYLDVFCPDCGDAAGSEKVTGEIYCGSCGKQLTDPPKGGDA